MSTGAWTCPDCGRVFARRRQGHDCAPAMSPAAYYETGPAFERPVHVPLLAHLDTLGAPHVEHLSVGLFVKREGHTVAQLRTMTRWVAVALWLPRVVASDRIARTVVPAGSRWHHVVNVRTPGEVDEQLLGWLTEAWEAAAG